MLCADRRLSTNRVPPIRPLLVLQSYGWRVDGPQILTLPPRFEPQEGDVIGMWLAPPSAGWHDLAVKAN